MLVANRYVKRYSISLVIREMLIKTTMNYHLAPVRMAVFIKNTTNVGEDVEKREPSYTVYGNIIWYSHCEKQYGSFSKN